MHGCIPKGKLTPALLRNIFPPIPFFLLLPQESQEYYPHIPVILQLLPASAHLPMPHRKQGKNSLLPQFPYRMPCNTFLPPPLRTAHIIFIFMFINIFYQSSIAAFLELIFLNISGSNLNFLSYVINPFCSCSTS